MKKIVVLLLILCNICFLKSQSNFFPQGMDVTSEKGETCYYKIDTKNSSLILNTSFNYQNSIALVNCLFQLTYNIYRRKIEISDLIITDMYIKDTITEQGYTIFNEKIFKDNYYCEYGLLINSSEMNKIETSLKSIVNLWDFMPLDTTNICIPNDIYRTSCQFIIVIH